jgi:hypothetical protein
MRAVLCKHIRLLALGLCAAHCVKASGLPANFTVFPSEKAPIGAHSPSIQALLVVSWCVRGTKVCLPWRGHWQKTSNI